MDLKFRLIGCLLLLLMFDFFALKPIVWLLNQSDDMMFALAMLAAYAVVWLTFKITKRTYKTWKNSN